MLEDLEGGGLAYLKVTSHHSPAVLRKTTKVDVRITGNLVSNLILFFLDTSLDRYRCTNPLGSPDGK
jgi:hypothetical protein